jgi:dolichyl-phosphate mannosyltransferase polypeptide 3
MSRGQNYIVALIGFAFFWFFANRASSKNPPVNQVVQALPGWLLITFGCYALISIGRGIAILRDSPEDHDELLNDITRCKEILKKQGFKS